MRGGHSSLKYALIGLAPYSFHYDQSKTFKFQNRLLQYLIAFRDLHNFHVSVEDCEKIFQAKYLNAKLSLEPFDLNNPYMTPKLTERFMTPRSRLKARKEIEKWSEKNYPETRAENIKILDDYLTLCEENGIRPIMFLPPMTEGYVKYFSRKKLDEFYCLVEQACRKHSSAVFVDGWLIDVSRSLFTDEDFYDVSHLNVQGAAKFSMFLNEVIEGLEN